MPREGILFVKHYSTNAKFITNDRDILKEKYDVEFTEPDSETLSGYIINHYEKIPQQKERIIIDDYEFEILTVSDTRIEMVKMKILK